jgi:hypothetical protein
MGQEHAPQKMGWAGIDERLSILRTASPGAEAPASALIHEWAYLRELLVRLQSVLPWQRLLIARFTHDEH